MPTALPANLRKFLKSYNEALEFPEEWKESEMPEVTSPEWKAIVKYFESGKSKRNERTEVAEYFNVNRKRVLQRIHRAIHGSFPLSSYISGELFDLLGSITGRNYYRSSDASSDREGVGQGGTRSNATTIIVSFFSPFLFPRSVLRQSRLLCAGRKSPGKRRADASPDASPGASSGGDGGDRGDSAIRARRAERYADASPPETHNAA